MTSEAHLVEIYERVRNLPYDTAAAHDARSVRAQGRGNCVAKAALLAEELSACGVVCRLVSWEYELPVLVEVQSELLFSSDIHTTVMARADGRWCLVDPTHDPALSSLGLTVGRWDGASATEPAYPIIGSIVPHDQRGAASQLDQASARIGQQVEDTNPDLIAQYQRDLNELFEQARRS